MSEHRTAKQCKSRPWRVGASPERDIPGYSRTKHEGLAPKVDGPQYERFEDTLPKTNRRRAS